VTYLFLALGMLFLLVAIMLRTGTMRAHVRAERYCIFIGVSFMALAVVSAIADPANWAPR